jgi:hypothetical protein
MFSYRRRRQQRFRGQQVPAKASPYGTTPYRIALFLVAAKRRPRFRQI